MTHVAPWGELATLSCIKKGIAGVVIDGAVRDVDDIRAMKFPLFAKAIVPNAGEPKGFGEINAEIRVVGSLSARVTGSSVTRAALWLFRGTGIRDRTQGARGQEERGADPRGDPQGEHPLRSGRTDKVGKKIDRISGRPSAPGAWRRSF